MMAFTVFEIIFKNGRPDPHWTPHPDFVQILCGIPKMGLWDRPYFVIARQLGGPLGSTKDNY